MLLLLWILLIYGTYFGLHLRETTPYIQANKIYWYVAIPLNALSTSLASNFRMQADAAHMSISRLLLRMSY
jgi:hypothetical protein